MSNALNKGAGSEASLPVTSRSRRSAPKLLFRLTQHCRARWARPTSRGSDSASCCWSFSLQGFRLCGGESGALRSPQTPLHSALPCCLTFLVAKGSCIYPPSFSGKKFPKGAFPPCAKRKSMLQYARIEAFERAEPSAPVRENVFVDNPDEELRKEDFSYAVRLL